MEVLRDCQSPIEMNSFEVDMNSKSGRISPERQAMIPSHETKNSLNNNSNHSNNAEKNPNEVEAELGFFNHFVAFLCIIVMLLTFPLSLLFCIKVTQEYERAVIFRLGRVLPGSAKGPGLLFVLPCIDEMAKVDLRTVTINIPPQEALTRDSVTVTVDAVVYFFIKEAKRSVTKIRNAAGSTKLLAQTTLRNMIGTKTLAEALLDREDVSRQMQAILDEATTPWGVKVERKRLAIATTSAKINGRRGRGSKRSQC
ncbi:mechanosensory protein 2-like isoform X2 [Rhopilema esculentum]|uniref:mechanosensory protein 2-like isoform X2 n=1 Tax=Rhopilema esculentum TaxID=499914 RepID=UPI0031D431FB